jgi:hypothetical protein
MFANPLSAVSIGPCLNYARGRDLFQSGGHIWIGSQCILIVELIREIPP